MSAIESAERVAHEYTTREAKKAIMRAERHRLDERGRCNCNSCVNSDISEANKWLDWLDKDGKQPRYVNEAGKVELRYLR